MQSLEMQDIPRSYRLLYESILTTLLEAPDMACKDDDLFNNIREYENKIIKESKSKDALFYADKNAIDIYKTVLEVALEDKDISSREFVLLKKLRKKLNITRLENRLLEAQLKMYPKPDNELHQLDEFKKALVELQKRGVLFCCNKNTNGNLIVLPEEIKPYVKEVLEIELREEAYKNLLNQLTTQQLFTALKSSDLFVSGTKEERISRIIKSGLQPSEVLDALSATDIHEICKKLKGIKTSGSKNDRINRIINYFSSMSNKEPQVNEDKRSLYYQYFEELASRDNKELYGKKIINRDIDIEKFFEEATHYLFEEKLGLELMQLQGNEHADGCIAMKKDEILLWDNKSKEKLYEFPASHYKQFRRYIRESAKRVNTFLIIVSDVNEKKVKDQATRLSWESNTKTDIAIIRAGDLKHIAEKWKSFISKKNTLFDPIVFSYTGVLSRSQLENNLKLL